MKRILRAFLFLVLLAAIAGGVGLYFGYSRLHEEYRNYAEAEVFVDVPTGAGPASIAQRLVDAGVVRDVLTFRAAVYLSGHARDLKAGEYQFDRPLSVFQVVDKIAHGDVYRRTLTFREGLTIREMAQVYEDGKFGARADFETAARDASRIRSLDPDAKDLEGYLFPETYSLRRDTPASELVDQMVALFEKTLTPELRDAA